MRAFQSDRARSGIVAPDRSWRHMVPPLRSPRVALAENSGMRVGFPACSKKSSFRCGPVSLCSSSEHLAELLDSSLI